MRKAKKFILNAVILTAASLILRSAGMWFTVYISGKIEPAGMGVYQLITSVYMFAVTIAASGIGLTAARLVAEELAVGSASGVKAAVTKCAAYSLVSSAIAAILLFVYAGLITEHWLHGKVSVTVIYALALSLTPIALSSVFAGYFNAVRRVIKTASANIFEQAIRISVTVYLLNLMLPQGLDYACLALVLGGAAAEILSFLYLFTLYLFDKRRYRTAGAASCNLTRRMLNISLPVAVSACIRSLLNTLKQVIIPTGLTKSGMSSEAAIAQYGIIRGMVMPVLLFPSAFLSAFSSLLIPEMAENHIQNRRKQINYIISRIFKITLIFSIGAGGILLFFANELSVKIYNNPEVAVFIKILSPLVVVMYFDDIVDAILKGINEQVSVVAINILDTAAGIGLLYTLLPIGGIKGYITVIFISEILNGGLSIGRLIRTTKFELKFTQWIIFPAASITAAVIITKMINAASLTACIAAAAGIYLLILYAAGIITAKDLKI